MIDLVNLVKNPTIASVTSVAKSGYANSWRPVKMSEDKQRMYYRAADGYQLVTNSILPVSSWEEMDTDVKAAAEPISTAYEMFKKEGLINNKFGVGSKLASWEVDDERVGVEVSIEGDRVTFDTEDPVTQSTPVPVLMTGFKIGWRTQEGHKAAGTNLVTRGPSNGSKAVAKGREDMIFNGHPIAINGHKVHGILNAPGILKGTPAEFGAISFDDDLEAAHDCVLRVLESLSNRKAYGPFGLFIGERVYQHLRKVHKDGSRERLRAGIEDIEDIKWLSRSHFMPTDSLSVVQLNKDNFEIIEQLKLQTRQHGSPLSMSELFIIMTVMAPAITVDHEGRAAVAHLENCFSDDGGTRGMSLRSLDDGDSEDSVAGG